MSDTSLVVFTDLDGTLLDALTYRYDHARHALEVLKAHNVPLIFCTSKTRAEVECLRQELQNTDPFIIENGGALYIPVTTFSTIPQGANERDGYWVIEIGCPYHQLREALHYISRQTGHVIVGFGDMTLNEIIDLTRLSPDQARRAQQREYDEPFLLPDSPLDLDQVRAAAARLGLTVVQGGRFAHLTGGNDKGQACWILIELYRQDRGPVVTAAFGDSLNDAEMLGEVDYPVLVEQPSGGHQAGISMEQLVCASGIGPAGWATGVEDLLRKLDHIDRSRKDE